MNLADAVAEYRAAHEAVPAAKAEAKDLVAGAQARVRKAQETLETAIVADARKGKRMRDLTRETGMSREWVRTMLRRNGVTAED